MKERTRAAKPTKDQLTKPYKKTPFDREEKPRIEFVFDEGLTARERLELQSREKLYHHRWKEERESKARQSRRSKKWQRENEKLPQTWRDVHRDSRNHGIDPR